MWACCYFRESTFFSALGRSFFDDAASTETQAHRSNGPYQRISLRHLLCSATICSTPMQGTRSWDRVYCCPTAAKPPVERAGHSTFLRYLQVKRRADERTRTAYPCSLRVCGQWLLRVALACKSRINRRLLFPRLLTIAGYCVWVRVKSARITRRRFLCKSVVASSRGSAELTRRSPHKRLPPPCSPPRPIHHSGHPCRANTCSVDFHA
jgi:hypothetical protein